jgi:predicted TIM-barrel fold metal-dependent hydrolase
MGSATGVITDHIKRFYVDTVSGWPPAVRFCCDFFGADRIMFGTDHPFWPMSAGVRVLEEAGLSAEDREKIEHLTAERLFGIQVPAREGG